MTEPYYDWKDDVNHRDCIEILSHLCKLLDCEIDELLDRVINLRNSVVSPALQIKVDALHQNVETAVKEISEIVENNSRY